MSFSEKNRYRGRRERKTNKVERHGNRWIYLTVITILFLMGLSIYILKDRENNKKNGGDESYASKEEIQQVVDALNQKSEYLFISKSDDRRKAVLIGENGKPEAGKPAAEYVISVQDKYLRQISVFEREKYVMTFWSEKHRDKSEPKLCEVIDKALSENDEILKALQEAQVKGQISLALWGIAEIGGEFTLPQKWLIEIAAALRKLSGVKAKKIEILIKGYADGQGRPWKEKLRLSPYNYNSVTVYEPLEEERETWFEYVRKDTVHPVNEYYTNSDLPDLRARFVKEELIDRALKYCESNTQTEVHILKGQAKMTDEIYEPDRKVEIFVNIY